MKHVICYSGGHSSALVAVEAVRRYSKENVILLNHNITEKVEHPDIQRFKEEVANYLGLEITYANMENWDTMDQLDVCVSIGAFKVGQGTALCTNRMKTEPFHNWLKENYPVEKGEMNEDVTIYYGFDKKETVRITRRLGIMASMGYKTAYPLASWDRTIQEIEELGIERPITYKMYKHANCIGCLKAGRQQWFITYCKHPELWEKAKRAEETIGYSIIKGIYLKELEYKFKKMQELGILPTEKTNANTFWAMVRKELKADTLPCECGV